MFSFRRKPVLVPVDVPHAVKPRGPACILYAGEVGILIPAIGNLLKGAITTQTLALMFDTLNNSAIVPPAPWRQVPHKFDSLVHVPSFQQGVIHQVPAFVFYSL